MRRAAADGTIRCERLGSRRQNVDDQEYRYAVTHWPLLAKLRKLLRTEPNVRLAVVYGSTARGDDTSSSDLDLLVSFAEDHPEAAVKLAVRLEHGLGRAVDVGRLDRVRDTAPLLLLQVIDSGRIVLDRDGMWAELQTQRDAIEREAHRAHQAQRRRARISVDELLAATNDRP
jgi:predicted nucleotidyltransferase